MLGMLTPNHTQLMNMKDIRHSLGCHSISHSPKDTNKVSIPLVSPGRKTSTHEYSVAQTKRTVCTHMED